MNKGININDLIKILEYVKENNGDNCKIGYIWNCENYNFSDMNLENLKIIKKIEKKGILAKSIIPLNILEIINNQKQIKEKCNKCDCKGFVLNKKNDKIVCKKCNGEKYLYFVKTKYAKYQT